MSLKPTFKNFVVLVVVLYIAYNIFGIGKEMFHNSYGTGFGRLGGSGTWWNPRAGNYTMHPYTHAPHPYGIDPSEEAQGDLRLTNLYRKWHNIENVNRIGVLEHSHLKQPGGDDGTNRQFYIAEAMDREAMRMQKLIRDDIAAKRRPYTDAYAEGVPHTALGGNFYECHIGDCQWDQDNDGKILGIPSTLGTRHPYY